MEFLIPIVIVGTVFGSIAYICYLILDLFKTRHRIRAASELQSRLIDRLSAQDVGPFLSSEQGAQIMRAIGEAPVAADAGHGRILRALQAGLVLLAVGLGMFLYMNAAPPPLDPEDSFGLGMTATIATALGVGLLAAAGAAYALSRRLGLLARAEPE